MKWIALAIVVFIGGYTYLTLHYRKAGPAYEPYENMKTRANVARLLSAGYQRIPLPAQRPADRMTPIVSATIAPAAGGLPDPLRRTLVDAPELPSDITNVAAPPEASTRDAYTFRFACTLPDPKRLLAGADLYVHGDEIVIAADYEKISGGLLARTNDNVVELTVPAGTLKPGRYRVTLAGAQSSRAWTLQVK
ncbi:MAG TPA: hypothetical protein VHD62_10475 [Opitutaceae bacterium]|nr:hypothetical protein [Opitutaceae bacterium]